MSLNPSILQVTWWWWSEAKGIPWHWLCLPQGQGWPSVYPSKYVCVHKSINLENLIFGFHALTFLDVTITKGYSYSCKGLFEIGWVKLSKLLGLARTRKRIKKPAWSVFWSDVWTEKWLTSHSAWAWSFEVSEQYSFWGGPFLFVYSFSRSQVSEFLWEVRKKHFELILGQNNAVPQFVFSVLAQNPSRILPCAWDL